MGVGKGKRPASGARGAVLTPVLLSVLSAALVAASFPAPGTGWVAFAALAPLLLALRMGSSRQAAGLAFLFGYLHGVAVFRWLPGVEGVGYPVFLLLLAPIYSLYYTAFGVSYHLVDSRFPRLGFLAAPALWVAVEYARANMFFLALPWNLLGHTQHRTLAVIGIADLTGVYGISFLLVLVNEAVSRWLEAAGMVGRRGMKSAERKRWAAPGIPAIAAVLALGFTVSWSLDRGRPDTDQETIKVALLQPNIVLKETMSHEDLEHHLDTYARLTREAAEEGVDLIAWPASSLPGSIDSRAVKIRMGALLSGLEPHLLVGGSGGPKMTPAAGKGERYANSEFLLRPGRRPGGVYHKQHLVPFNEYLPLNGFITWPRWITTLEGSYRPGDHDTLFVLKRGRFGVPICWESLFPDLFRGFVRAGARFMVNPTNEAYMGDTAGPYQTHAMNVFRAVENRLALARVSATGISSFIGPDGRVLERVHGARGEDLFVAGMLVRDIPLSKARTFYTLHGDVFAWAMIALSLLFLASALRGGRTGGG